MGLNGLLGFKGPTHLIPTHLTALIISITSHNVVVMKKIYGKLYVTKVVNLSLSNPWKNINIKRREKKLSKFLNS